MDNEFHEPKNGNEEMLKQRIAQVKEFLKSLGVAFRTDITESLLTLYIGALLPIDPDVLQMAIARGVQDWRFFPTIAEILEIVRQYQAARADAAYERMVQRYVKAHREGTLPKYPFMSLLDVRRQIGGARSTPESLAALKEQEEKLAGRELTEEELQMLFPTRDERLRLGLEQPRQLTEEEFNGRIKELQAQRDLLKQSKPEVEDSSDTQGS